METGRTAPGEGRSYWVMGDHYTIKASGEQTGGAFALIEAWVPPGAGPPPHVHRREDEAFYLLEGELQFEADGQSFSAGPGAWITLAKGSLHRFQNTSATPARMLILVSPAGLERFFAEIGRPATRRDPAEGAVTPTDIEKLIMVAPRYGLEIHPPSHTPRSRGKSRRAD